MKPGSAFNIPLRIFLLTFILAMFGLVMVYSASASYVVVSERMKAQNTYKKLVNERKELLAAGQEAPELPPPPPPNTDHVYHKPDLFLKQACWLGIGLVAMFCFYFIDYNHLKDWGFPLMIVSLFLLVLVFVPGIGKTINGHQRWIKLGPMTLQPSEFAKLALVIYMAQMLNKHRDKMKSFFHGVFPSLGLVGIFAALMVMEPDIGATAVMVTIIFVMWFIGGMRKLHLMSLFAAIIPAFALVIIQFPDRVQRVLAFLNPTDDRYIQGAGYQLVQSLIAIGSGGATGVGLGNSMQKHFLTEQYSEFIFSIACEELGFIGGMVIIICFLFLIWQGWVVAFRVPDFYSSLLASGITLMLTISVGLNMMVVLGLVPTKGLSLPLLSYGGSNLLVTMASMGILMNIGAYVEQERIKESSSQKVKKRTKSASLRQKKKPTRKLRGVRT